MKYRLKKWYPSLPKDWEVGMEVEKCTTDKRYYVSNQWHKPLIFQTEVENNPEFWERVVEKDWEIVALISSYGKVSTHYKDGKVKWSTDDDPEFTEIQELLNVPKSEHSIYSVKRLSDGEIFSVGDKLDFRDGEVRKITGISLDDVGVSEFSKRGIPWLECGKDYGTCLDWAVHYKKPILITEDGVGLFEGDKFYFVDTWFEYYEGTVCDSDMRNKYKHFSTKELAEKYIEENKPMYSKKDMLSFGASMSPTLYPYQCEGCLEQWKKFKKRE